MRSLLFAASLLLAGNAHAWTDLSFYGDSFVFRSGWTCAGMNLTPQQCSDLRLDSSFVTHVPYPYGYTTTPAFDITHVDGIGGSTCLGASHNPVPLADRLEDHGEGAVVVMIGINDVNLGGRTVQETVACLVDAWTVISDEFDAIPVAVKYPPIDASATTWQGWGTSGAQARQNAISLNSAIGSAVSAFNQSRGSGQKRAILVNFSNAYNPTPGGYTSDGVHPNPAGAVRLARYFFAYMH